MNTMNTDAESILRDALGLACARIADGPQEYHEANTAGGWAEKFICEAENGCCD